MNAESEQLGKWLAGMRSAAPVLEQMRFERIRNIDTVKEIQALDSAYRAAKSSDWKKPPTGLIHLRRILDRMGR